MKRIALTVTDAPTHRFKGELLAATFEEARVLRRGTLNREAISYRLYRDEHESFFLYEDRRNVGTGDVERKLHLLPSIADLDRLLPDELAERLINQFLSSIAKA